jgi:hypothetical protein
MWYSEPYRSAIILQRLLMADSGKGDLTCRDRAAIAHAFCELEELKRKLRMKPLPKAIDVGRDGKAPRARGATRKPGFEET